MSETRIRVAQMSVLETMCLTHLWKLPCPACPETLTVRWQIDIPKIPVKANYTGPPHATLLKRLKGETHWTALGHLMLSANPECQAALKELVDIANRVTL